MRMWMAFGILALFCALLLDPVPAAILLSVILAVGLWARHLGSWWRFLEPERHKLARSILLTVDVGPVAGGLVPFAGFLCLLGLLLVATTGVRP